MERTLLTGNQYLIGIYLLVNVMNSYSIKPLWFLPIVFYFIDIYCHWIKFHLQSNSIYNYFVRTTEKYRMPRLQHKFNRRRNTFPGILCSQYRYQEKIFYPRLKVIDSNNENIQKSKEIMLMEDIESLKSLALFLKDASGKRLILFWKM